MMSDAKFIQKGSNSYTFSRWLDIPIEVAWRFWTEPEHLQHWFAPKDFEMLALTADVVVGGKWRAHFRAPQGDTFVTHGSYLEIEPEKRLLMTQLWQGSEHQTEITVTFSSENAGTKIIFEHRYQKSEASRDSQARGWIEVFERLERYIS